MGSDSSFQWISEVWAAVTGRSEIAVFLGLLGLARWVVGGMVSQGASREQFAGWLDGDTIGGRYRDLLRGMLDRFDGWLTPQPVLDELREADRPGWRLQARRAWTVTLYDRCLLIAVVYPLLILLIVWTVTGDEGRIGDLVVLGDDVPLWWRGVMLGGVALAMFFARLSATRGNLAWKLGFLGLAGAVAFGSAVAGVVAGALAFAFSGPFTGAGTVAGAGPVAVAGAVAIAGTVAFTVAGAVAVALAIAVAAAVAVAFAVAFAAGVAGVAGIMGAVIGAVAVAVAGAVSVAVQAAVRRGWKPGLAYAGLTIFLALEVVGVAGLVGNLDERSFAPLVFLGVLPLANAVFDFASIGFTRWALRRGLDHPGPWMWGWTTIDLAGAAVLFLGLKASAVFAVCALNAAAGGGPADGVLDLAALFADIRANPDDYWWLYLGFLTTLIPTVLHLGVVSFAVLASLPVGIRTQWARFAAEAGFWDKAEGHWLKQQWVTLGAAAWLALAVSLPVWFFGWAMVALNAWGADLGGFLLSTAEGVARLTGALP